MILENTLHFYSSKPLKSMAYKCIKHGFRKNILHPTRVHLYVTFKVYRTLIPHWCFTMWTVFWESVPHQCIFKHREGQRSNSKPHLHWMMWETMRAALVSLQISRPQARSCLIWRANRYLKRNKKKKKKTINGGESERKRYRFTLTV